MSSRRVAEMGVHHALADVPNRSPPRSGSDTGPRLGADPSIHHVGRSQDSSSFQSRRCRFSSREGSWGRCHYDIIPPNIEALPTDVPNGTSGLGKGQVLETSTLEAGDAAGAQSYNFSVVCRFGSALRILVLAL